MDNRTWRTNPKSLPCDSPTWVCQMLQTEFLFVTDITLLYLQSIWPNSLNLLMFLLSLKTSSFLGGGSLDKWAATKWGTWSFQKTPDFGRMDQMQWFIVYVLTPSTIALPICWECLPFLTRQVTSDCVTFRNQHESDWKEKSTKNLVDSELKVDWPPR